MVTVVVIFIVVVFVAGSLKRHVTVTLAERPRQLGKAAGCRDARNANWRGRGWREGAPRRCYRRQKDGVPHILQRALKRASTAVANGKKHR